VSSLGWYSTKVEFEILGKSNELEAAELKGEDMPMI